jgi:hypothetical protein
MRTAYQGKQFEFMTNIMRKPKMHTIDELVDSGYKIYTGTTFNIATDAIMRFVEKLNPKQF